MIKILSFVQLVLELETIKLEEIIRVLKREKKGKRKYLYDNIRLINFVQYHIT